MPKIHQDLSQSSVYENLLVQFLEEVNQNIE